jgi:hypothetical protein
MSNSILYHTFGIRSVQHFSTDFLTAGPFSAVLSMTTISSVPTVNLAISSGSAKSRGSSKHFLSEVERSN